MTPRAREAQQRLIEVEARMQKALNLPCGTPRHVAVAGLKEPWLTEWIDAVDAILGIPIEERI